MLGQLKFLLDTWGEILPWVLAFFVIFGVLAKLTPCNPQQKIWRRDLPTDLIYCFLMPFGTRFMRILFLSLGIYIIFRGQSMQSIGDYMKNGFGVLSKLAVWQQAAIIFLAEDFIFYWTHRWFHHRRLWSFHAIHHSPLEVDWLTTYRFHPVNSWFTFTLVDAIMMLIGFSPEAVTAMATFNLIYSAMVHANLNWTFGKFKYIFASPVFHRWHHTAQEEGMDKNFAPTFPLLDIVFGTFYMPDGRLPEKFGVAGSEIPSGFVDQMFWPFKQYRRHPVGREASAQDPSPPL